MEAWRKELYENELIHAGIKGQKWGVRRFQYEDGSLTPEGKRRYSEGTRLSREPGEHGRSRNVSSEEGVSVGRRRDASGSAVVAGTPTKTTKPLTQTTGHLTSGNISSSRLNGAVSRTSGGGGGNGGSEETVYTVMPNGVAWPGELPEDEQERKKIYKTVENRTVKNPLTGEVMWNEGPKGRRYDPRNPLSSVRVGQKPISKIKAEKSTIANGLAKVKSILKIN